MPSLFCTSTRFKEALRARYGGQDGAVESFVMELRESFPFLCPVAIGQPLASAFLEIQGNSTSRIYALRKAPGQLRPIGFVCYLVPSDMPPLVYVADVIKPREPSGAELFALVYDSMRWSPDFRAELEPLAVYPGRDPRLIIIEIIPLVPTLDAVAAGKALTKVLGYRLVASPKIAYHNPRPANNPQVATNPVPAPAPASLSTMSGLRRHLSKASLSFPAHSTEAHAPPSASSRNSLPEPILEVQQQLFDEVPSPPGLITVNPGSSTTRKRELSGESGLGKVIKGWYKRVRTQSGIAGEEPEPNPTQHLLEAMRGQMESHHQAMRVQMESHSRAMEAYMYAIEERLENH